MNISHKTLTPDEARALLARFEAGETSVAEETALFDYFASTPTLPADLEQLRPLMEWYAGGCEGEPDSPAAAPRRSFAWRPLMRMAAAVGAILIVALASLNIPTASQTDADDDFATIYAGSYVIRDGRKITDPAQIRSIILSRQAKLDSVNALIARAGDPKALMIKAIEKRYASSPAARKAALSTIL